MKNKLFIMILAVAICPLFADGKIDNGQLLLHLKDIKAEIMFFMGKYPSNDSEQYRFFSKIMNEFYDKAEILQTIVTNEIVRPEFELLCQNILSFDKMLEKLEELPSRQRTKILVPVEGGFRAQDPVEISEQVKRELFELFTPIFKELYQEHSQTSQDDFFVQQLTDELIKQCFEEMLGLVIWYPYCLIHNWPMIKLIDAKIAELETQGS